MENNTRLIPLRGIKSARPDWPFEEWWTGELIRRGDLGCVRIGRRVFVTDDLLETFIAKHVVAPK